MNRTMLLLAAMVMIAISAPLQAQTYPVHRRGQVRTVGHPAIQHGAIQHGAIQSSFKGADCGCAPVAAQGCSTCLPSCPPLIPCLLNKFDRLIKCLLPSCRVGCGGCGLCAGKYNGCAGCAGGGAIHGQGVIIDSNVIQQGAPQAAPKQTYYERRGTLQPRYQTSRTGVSRPTPVRRTAAPKPAKRTTATRETRTASAELKKIDEQRVNLQPAPKSNVRVASFEQSPKKSRIRNPLRN